MLALGEGKTGVFKVRQKELDADDYGQTILEETRKLNVGLGISVQQLVDGVQKRNRRLDLAGAAGDFVRDHGHARRSALATLVGSVLFVWLYVGRNILRRIGSLQRSMQLSVERRPRIGDLSDPASSDEIAAMANSLQVFRESMIEGRALSADQDKDRIAKAERASRMEARIVEFEATVRTALDSLQTRGEFDADHRAKHVGDRRSVQRAGERGGVRRRGNLGQRADRVVGHRGTVFLDRGNRPPGRHLGGNRPQGGRGSRRDRRHHAGACRQRRAASASWST